jgi:cytochrome b561
VMQFANTTQRWGLVSIMIHWLTAITVISMFVLGLWMVDLTLYDRWYNAAPDIHKSVGIILLIVTLVRLAWRLINATPAPLKNHSAFEKKAAHMAHVLIYVLLFSMMLSGYLISTADGRAIEVFDLFKVPATLYGIDQQEDIAGQVHLVLAITLMSLVAVHALAAIKHHIVDKDRTLLRMLGKL